MSRVNVYRYDEVEGRVLDGYFYDEAAELVWEARRWNGQNMVSVHTVDQFDHERLYRTKGGRWVLNRWSQWAGREPTYEFVAGDRAREWLLVNGSDDVVERYFGEIEEERGPGRPEVGTPVNLRLGDDLLTRVDAQAKRDGVSRAEEVRRLVTRALDAG